MTPSWSTTLLWVVLFAVLLGDIKDGYAALGAGSPGLFTVAHVLIVLAVAVRTDHVVRRHTAIPPWLSEEDRRYLARRPRAWKLSRALAILSVVPVIVIGAPDWERWLSFAGWTLLYGTIAALLIAAITLTWRSRWPLIAYLDPVKFGIAKLRVAERENYDFLVTDLVDSLGERIERTSPRRPRHASLLELRQTALVTRYRMTGERADLDKALTLGHSLLTVRPHRSDPGRLTRRMQLASTLQMAYQRTGDLRWLEEAIRMLREVVAGLPPQDARWSAATSNLAIALFEYGIDLDDAEVLRESVGLQRQAIATTPEEDYKSVLVRSLPSLLSPLARARRRAARAEVRQALVNAHHLPQRLVNLGTALLFLHHFDEEPEQLAEAEQALRRALAIMPAEHIQRYLALRQLADALLVKQHSGGEADLEEAAALLSEAVGALPDEHPDAATLHYLLGVVAQDQGDRHEAIGHWRRAAGLPTAVPAVRTAAAQRWGALAAEAGDWNEALEGYGIAVELLGRLAARSLARADQERLLSGPGGIVRDAAACALAAGQPEHAVELLELGRGILLGQALDTRSDLTLLREHHLELADEFVRVRDAFDRGPAGQPTDGIDPIAQRHALAEEWERVLAAIREMEEFHDFLRPRDANALARAAEGGAIVMVNASRLRCDALVLHDGAVHAIPLPDLTEDEAGQRVIAYFSAIRIAADPERTLRERARAEADLRELLAWLGVALADPVQASLPRGVPRLWWVCSGVLSYLPLHAATPLVSSYTPTIRVLEHARAQAATGLPEEALVVSVSAAEGFGALPGAATEAGVVRGRFDATRELIGPDATRAAVLDALAGAQLVHFACHAYGDAAAVSAGRLILHDQPLSVLDINQLRIHDGRLAFLSACTTAQPGFELPDEAIHLSSAFQLAGYAHVIATLWPTADDTAVAVAEAFYDNLARDLAPHAALHEAIAALPPATRMMPSLWASYIHVGP